MNKFFLSTLLGSLLFLTGCSKTTAFDFFSTDTYYEKSVSNMRTASLIKDGETKAILHAVYLNNIDKKEFHTQEYFFIAIHIIDEKHLSDKEGLNNPDYSLKMIEKVNIGTHKTVEARAVSVKKLKEDSRILRNMPIKNKWSYFYLVKFAEVNQDILTLSFQSKKYGKSNITFAKKEVILKNKGGLF